MSKKHFYEVVLKFGQWFRRCYLKICLILAMVAILFSGAEPFVQFW